MNRTLRFFCEILLACCLLEAVLFGPDGSLSVWLAASLVVAILRPERE
jgi:hypothetical protein